MSGRLVDPKSCPSTRSELSLFEVPTTQVVMDSARYVRIPTSTPITQSGPYDFVISDARHYLQMSRCYIAMKLKVTTPAATTGAALVNYIGNTFFQQVKVEINNSLIFNCSNYAYKSYLEALLNYSTDQKNGILQGGGYFEDGDNGLDSENNTGYKTRVECCKDGIVDVVAPLHIDQFNCDRLLVPHLNMHIQLYRNSDKFLIESHAATALASGSVSVQSMSLLVRAVNILPSASIALEKTMLSNTAKYPFVRTRVRCLNVPGSRTELPFSTIFTDTLPRRVVCGLIEQEAYDGAYSKSPFNFGHHNVREISIDAGGRLFPAQPTGIDFAGNNYAKAFLEMYENIGAVGDHRQLSIGYKKYKNGFSIFAFNLCPTDNNGEFELVRTGTTQIQIKFASPTPVGGLQLVVYAEYDAIMLIDAYRTIHTDQDV